MFRVVFPSSLWAEISQRLSKSNPKEDGGFLLAHKYSAGEQDVVITIVGIVEPDEDSWGQQGEHSLEPTSAFINRAVVAADSKDCGLLFVHTHPNSLHPPKFSPIDEDTNSKLLPNLAEILPNRPVGSMVLSQAGLYGVVIEKGKIAPVSSAKVCGASSYRIDTNTRGRKGKVNSEWFERQSRALGRRIQDELRNATVAIVGGGGTGSVVATMLARMGVTKLYLLDFDTLEASNLSRIYGAKPSDVGKAKVKILKKHLENFSDAQVEAIVADVTKNDTRRILAECDYMFGCTDNLASRALLNDIALQYYIPLIDVGCRIHLSSGGAIDQAVAKVQVVTPDSACLWCTGTLEGKAIMQESLSPEEKKKLEGEGYYEPTDKQPSVISITTLAASVALNKFLGLLGAFGEGYSTRTQIETKSELMINDSPPVREGCICSIRRGIGDDRTIAFPTLQRRRRVS